MSKYKPKEGNKLNSYDGDTTGKKKHPVVVTANNLDDTSRVLGCSSNYHKELGDIEIETDTPMPKKTYGRLADGERDIKNSKLSQDREERTCTNLDKLKELL